MTKFAYLIGVCPGTHDLGSFDNLTRWEKQSPENRRKSGTWREDVEGITFIWRDNFEEIEREVILKIYSQLQLEAEALSVDLIEVHDKYGRLSEDCITHW